MQCIPDHLQDELQCLYQFASEHQTHLIPMTQWPAATIDQLPFWQSLVHFLLTSTYQFRKTVNKNQGFPAEKQAKSKDEKQLYKAQKQAMCALLDTLSSHFELQQALTALAHCPTPYYTDRQWTVLSALLQLLPTVAAQLHLLFAETGTVDFNEINLGALHALRDQHGPTDLALLLDYQLQHILIDEFQDTSLTQFNLLEALTTTWQATEGKTLFLVGDPMQSIYRFRQADVGLFLKARHDGIGDIALIPLQLSVNFRSAPAVVDWINHCFSQLFPTLEETSTGAIGYAKSVAARLNQPIQPSQQSACVKTHLITHKATSHKTDLQAKYITALIKDLQIRNAQANIAVLVRSRSHLTGLLPDLHNAGISFTAVDIAHLDKQRVIQDLLNLNVCFIISD